jgi:polar amino acid transport system substrate-binding protein
MNDCPTRQSSGRLTAAADFCVMSLNPSLNSWRCKMKKILIYFLTITGIIVLTSMPLQGAPLKVCGDGAEWPPYTYSDPNKKGNVIGAATDTLREILKRADYEFEIELLPWKRCLSYVARGEYAIVIDATYSEERSEKYFFSKSFYTIHSGLFYLTRKFPKKPVIDTVQEMKKYTYCGLLGYNYSMYDIPESNLDLGALNEEARFNKLRKGRCDFVLGDIEILKGFVMLGNLNLKGTDFIPIPESNPKKFYMLVTRNPVGEKLLKVINEGLDHLRADGTYDIIFKKYGIK